MENEKLIEQDMANTEFVDDGINSDLNTKKQLMNMELDG